MNDLAARVAESIINERYRTKNLAKSPWKSLPDESWDKWTDAVQKALEAHGLIGPEQLGLFQ